MALYKLPHVSMSLFLACRLSKIIQVHEPTKIGKIPLCVISPDSGSACNDWKGVEGGVLRVGLSAGYMDIFSL